MRFLKTVVLLFLVAGAAHAGSIYDAAINRAEGGARTLDSRLERILDADAYVAAASGDLAAAGKAFGADTVRLAIIRSYRLASTQFLQAMKAGNTELMSRLTSGKLTAQDAVAVATGADLPAIEELLRSKYPSLFRDAQAAATTIVQDASALAGVPANITAALQAAVRTENLNGLLQSLGLPVSQEAIMREVMRNAPAEYQEMLKALQSGDFSKWIEIAINKSGINFGNIFGGIFGNIFGVSPPAGSSGGEAVTGVSLQSPAVTDRAAAVTAPAASTIRSAGGSTLSGGREAQARLNAIQPMLQVGARAEMDTAYVMATIRSSKGQGLLQVSRQDALSVLRLLEELCLTNFGIARTEAGVIEGRAAATGR